MKSMYNITLTSEPTMPKNIDNRVLGLTVPLVDMNRQWSLDIQKQGHEDSMTIWIEVDPKGVQIGDTRFGLIQTDIDLNEEVCAIMAMFLNLKFETIFDCLSENAKMRAAEEQQRAAENRQW